MDLNRTISFVTTIIMFAFAAIVLQRFVRRRHLHNLFWGLGLLMFGVGAFAEAALSMAWNDLLFRSWYLFGAMLNAGWLGHGTLLLLVRRRWVHYLTLALVILSVIGVAAMTSLTLNDAAFSTSLSLGEQYKEILPKGAPVRMLTPIFNIYGSVFLIGGAIYSAYLFWRKQVLLNRVAGNILIAAGGISVASAGTLSRLFFGGFLGVSQLIAAVLMFAGFILATSPSAMRSSATEHVQRTA